MFKLFARALSCALHQTCNQRRICRSALIVKGIIALLIKVVSGHTPDEILDNELYFIEAIGLKDHLSPTRSNGLLAMVKQMRMYALAFKAKMA